MYIHVVISARCRFFWWQDAYWTAGRSVLLGDSFKLHPSKKHMAIDGRVRVCCPSQERAFCLYWAITRTQVERHNRTKEIPESERHRQPLDTCKGALIFHFEVIHIGPCLLWCDRLRSWVRVFVLYQVVRSQVEAESNLSMQLVSFSGKLAVSHEHVAPKKRKAS